MPRRYIYGFKSTFRQKNPRYLYLRHFASEAKDVGSQEQLLFEQQLAVFRVIMIRLPELQLLLSCFPLPVDSHRNPVHKFHSEENIIN
jgi:hypothetical protein